VLNVAMFNTQRRGLIMATHILRLPAVKERTGLSRSTIYARMAEGTFPTSIALGGRAVGWVEAEINEWLEQHIAASRSASKKQINSGEVQYDD
jgi:prophage regulatory protein